MVERTIVTFYKMGEYVGEGSRPGTIETSGKQEILHTDYLPSGITRKVVKDAKKKLQEYGNFHGVWICAQELHVHKDGVETWERVAEDKRIDRGFNMYNDKMYEII